MEAPKEPELRGDGDRLITGGELLYEGKADQSARRRGDFILRLTAACWAILLHGRRYHYGVSQSELRMFVSGGLKCPDRLGRQGCVVVLLIRDQGRCSTRAGLWEESLDPVMCECAARGEK